MRRSQSLALIGSALLLPRCSAVVANGLRIGSTNSDENTTIAEIYARALERRNIRVERHLRLGEAADTVAALQRGAIDLCPGLIEAGKPQYWRRYGITALTPSPANESPCLLTSQYAAEQFWLLRLTKCSAIAPQLRLAATPDFLDRGGALESLQRLYGGFQFKSVVKSDPGTQYYVLNRGDADVANGFNTDGPIVETQLIVLNDDRHFWPERHLAPLVRIAALRAHPHVNAILEPVSRTLTLYALQQLNTRRLVLDMDPFDAADEFVTRYLDIRVPAR